MSRRKSVTLVVIAAVGLAYFSIVLGPRSPVFSAVGAFPRIGVLIAFVAIVGGARTSATVLGAAGGGLALVSILADNLRLGSQNGVFGRWQLTGVVIGVVVILGAGLWHKRMNDLERIVKRDRPNQPEDGQNETSRLEDLSLWARRGVWAGAVAVAISIYLGDPALGGGVLGWWRIAMVALGLLAIGAGLTAVLLHSVWRVAVKATLVVVTVAAVGISVFAWDQVPPAPPSCSEVASLTVDHRGLAYCYDGDGTLVREAIRNVNGCGRRPATFERRRYQQLLPEWRVEWHTLDCEL